MLLVPSGGAGGSALQVISQTVYTVPTAVAIRDLVYLTGPNSADRADNTTQSTTPARGVVFSKLTPTSAILLYSGELGGFSGLTVAELFLGTLGGLIDQTGLSALVSGNVKQSVGEAINSTTLLFQLGDVIVL